MRGAREKSERERGREKRERKRAREREISVYLVRIKERRLAPPQSHKHAHNRPSAYKYAIQNFWRGSYLELNQRYDHLLPREVGSSHQ